MSGKTARSILLHSNELSLLLGGCGIGDLLLPACIDSTVGEWDAALAFVRLSRDGLLPPAQDGVLEYSDEMREVLLVLRECTDELVMWTSQEPMHPFCIYLAQSMQRAVMIRADALRSRALNVSIDSALCLCEYVLEEACSVSALAADYRRPQAWPWEDMLGEGVLLGEQRFVRGSSDATSSVLVLRTVESDQVAERCDGVVHELPFTARSLLPWNRRKEC